MSRKRIPYKSNASKRDMGWEWFDDLVFLCFSVLVFWCFRVLGYGDAKIKLGKGIGG